MALRLFTADDKLLALSAEIDEARKARRDPSSPAQRHYQVLKSIAADIRARRPGAPGEALLELEGALDQLKKGARGEAGYDEGRMVAVANVVINKWPAIRQALEQFAAEEETTT